MGPPNPFRTTVQKPWLKPLSVAFTRESSFQGFLGGATFRPSTLCIYIYIYMLDFHLDVRCSKLVSGDRHLEGFTPIQVNPTPSVPLRHGPVRVFSPGFAGTNVASMG